MVVSQEEEIARARRGIIRTLLSFIVDRPRRHEVASMACILAAMGMTSPFLNTALARSPNLFTHHRHHHQHHRRHRHHHPPSLTHCGQFVACISRIGHNDSARGSAFVLGMRQPNLALQLGDFNKGPKGVAERHQTWEYGERRSKWLVTCTFPLVSLPTVAKHPTHSSGFSKKRHSWCSIFYFNMGHPQRSTVFVLPHGHISLFLTLQDRLRLFELHLAIRPLSKSTPSERVTTRFAISFWNPKPNPWEGLAKQSLFGFRSILLKINKNHNNTNSNETHGNNSEGPERQRQLPRNPCALPMGTWRLYQTASRHWEINPRHRPEQSIGSHMAHTGWTCWESTFKTRRISKP